MAFPLLQYFFVCASIVSYVVFVLSFVPHLSFLWCLGRAVLHDSGISYNFVRLGIVLVYT